MRKRVRKHLVYQALKNLNIVRVYDGTGSGAELIFGASILKLVHGATVQCHKKNRDSPAEEQ